ncbi:MAG TPA: hypothetical protein ENH91_14295 [Leeuwenhoekiella sp.]|nr:hypothetical protein [Leeuwenhoekiella sp.]
MNTNFNFYKNVILFTISLLSNSIQAQVGIGNTDPSNSALLDIHNANNDKGVLIPRVDIQDLSKQEPIVGIIEESLLVYNTNTATEKGFYYWDTDNSIWIKLNTGTPDNLYSANGTLTGNRTITAGTNFLQLFSSLGKTAFGIKRAQNATPTGIAFKNSDDTFDSNIYMQSGTQSGLVFATGGTNTDIESLASTLTLNNDSSIILNGYGSSNFIASPSYLLGTDASGNLVELAATDAFYQANQDWFKENTTSPPGSINDNIYTKGKVGINKINPVGTLHINETIGTSASNSNGTIYLEHDDAGGQSSIVFRSTADSNTDYGYIRYEDDGSGNQGSNENGLLEIGVSNDTPGSNVQDDINIDASGSLGVNTATPEASASIHLGRTNQGLLINKVQLASITDVNTITGNEPDGLLVYNTTANGTFPNNVIEGFYYWDNSKWNPFQRTDTNNNGMQYYTYDMDADENSSPDLTKYRDLRTPVKSGVYTGNLTEVGNAPFFDTVSTSDKTTFVLKLTGTYLVQNKGDFNFNIASDDGARMYIDGSLVLNDWSDSGKEGGDGVASFQVELAKGKHKIEFWYYENSGGEALTVMWDTNADGNSGVISATSFIIE